MTYLGDKLSFLCFWQEMFPYMIEKILLLSRLRQSGPLGLC